MKLSLAFYKDSVSFSASYIFVNPTLSEIFGSEKHGPVITLPHAENLNQITAKIHQARMERMP